MFDKLFHILRSAPVDMTEVMAAAQHGRSGHVLVAGDHNAAVLSLLSAVGAGAPELAAVHQPCVVECTRGEELRVTLTGDGASIRCSSAADLGLRLGWAENRNATAQITVPHDLFGLEKLVFAILDEQDFAARLQRVAPGTRGAVLVLGAFEAPAKAVYDFAAWLAGSCALADATAVLVQGHGAVTNTMPAVMCAMQMGVAQLPLTTCDLTREAPEAALRQALESVHVKDGFDEAALERSMAKNAYALLARQADALEQLTAPPSKAGRRLAECFEAEIPVARQQIEKLFTAELNNQIYSEMREFGIYLQKNITTLLVDGAAALEKQQEPAVKTKEALRAFSQSYLDELLSGFSRRLINALAQEKLMPQAKAIYDDMFRRAWIQREGGQAAGMAQQEVQELHTTVEKLHKKGTAVLTSLITYVILFLWPELRRSSRVVEALRLVVESVVTGAQQLLISPEALAKSKGGQLVDALGEIIAQYQDMVSGTMMPQLRDGLLGWFDDQSRLTLQTLENHDREQEANYSLQLAKAADDRQKIEEIRQVMAQLEPWQA